DFNESISTTRAYNDLRIRRWVNVNRRIQKILTDSCFISSIPLGPKVSTTHALSFNSSHTSLDSTMEEPSRLQVN
ncbi:hypothetical protein K443DRAFT_37152, partial [Laccaria amethystina LaAM-08-1]